MNHKILIFAVLIGDFFCSYAQTEGTMYINLDWHDEPKKKGEYLYRRKWKQVDSAIEIEDYWANGNLFQKGKVKSLEADFWKARDGKFIRYDRQGQKVSEGNFVEGAREGKWKYYLSSADHPIQEIVFKNDIVVYEDKLSDDGRFKLSEVQYADGSELMRKQYDSAGHLYYYAVLVNDQSIITSYYPDGKVKRLVTTIGDSLLSDINYTRNGEVTKNFDTSLKDWGANEAIDSGAVPGYDIMAFVRDNSDMPHKWRDNDRTGPVGKAYCRFTVAEDGSIRMPYILFQSDFELGEELLRVTTMLPKWKHSARRNNKNVPEQFTLPMTFEKN